MAIYQVILLILLQIINSSFASNTGCIPLEDCPVGLKYVLKRRNDPVTRNILRNAHCGHIRENKVFCNRIPKFEDLPEGCVSLSECPAAMELKKIREVDPEASQLLDAAACGYSGRKDMIICDNLVPRLREVAAVEKNKLNLLPSNTECGIQAPGVKITGGQRATFEDFPWLALLGYKNKNDKIIYRCHGSLINKRYIVTAAHCLKYSSQKNETLSKIVLGEYDTTQENDCFGGECTDPVQEFSPESIHVHPNFLSSQGNSDIALIRLNKNANYSDYVRSICLPIDSLRLEPNEWMLIGGWGKTENQKQSAIKLKATIKYLTNKECARFNIDRTEICAGSTNGTDTCKGDSGGPLMAVRQSAEGEQINILAGVVSYGGRCGSGSAIYSNVSVFVPWILKTIHE